VPKKGTHFLFRLQTVTGTTGARLDLGLQVCSLGSTANRGATHRHISAEEKATDGNKFIREFWALILVFLAVLLGFSLFSYSPADPTFNQFVGQEHVIQNQGGVAGAHLAGMLADLFGLGSVLIPVFLLAGALACVWRVLRPRWWRWAGFTLIFLCLVTAFESTQAVLFSIQGGGLLGNMLTHVALKYFRSASLLIWLFFCLLGVQLSLGLSWTTTGTRLKSRFKDACSKYRERFLRKQKLKVQKKIDPASIEAPDRRVEGQGRVKSPAKKPSVRTERMVVSAKLPFPPVDILSPVQESRSRSAPERLSELSGKVEACLADFGIQGEVQRVQPGPVVTMFEFKPAPGIKISRIAGLSDDLALALKALAVRIVAPLPGKDTVGIEVPNEYRQTVYLREIIESDIFRGTKFRVPLALGKDIQGQPRIADLTRMPHLLVAGATGAGKSVCLNSLILSMLFTSGPDRLKLLMIDPKRIELAVYGSLPHLIHPVVTEMHLAKSALDWAIYEMDQRYEAMARLGVRNIDAYNQRMEKGGVDSGTGEALTPMPYLVIIIDELADLMLTAAKEVEVSIIRLAQLARAAGIHMVLATQRPSVDVVTGLIKANFPCRIGFQVSSKHDSRTILDTVGAEHLLGLGDMLFKGGAGKLDRIHGTFVSDEEIGRMVEFWSAKREPDFALDFTEWKKEAGPGANGNGDGADIASDPLYAEAVNFVHDQGKASISFIQRRFRIGFNKAARFIEQMEQDGIIGPQDGSRPRQILKK
jgi:DNA segregation ATPase FtsK/SpoIIIE, S-DNA-T family